MSVNLQRTFFGLIHLKSQIKLKFYIHPIYHKVYFIPDHTVSLDRLSMSLALNVPLVGARCVVGLTNEAKVVLVGGLWSLNFGPGNLVIL